MTDLVKKLDETKIKNPHTPMREEAIANGVETDEELLKAIDWDALAKLVSKTVGEKITIKASLEDTRNDRYFQWKSQQLLDKAGILKAGLSSLTIESFGSSKTTEVLQDRRYWCTGSYRFNIAEGGSNGISLFRAVYDLEKKSWEYKPVGA